MRLSQIIQRVIEFARKAKEEPDRAEGARIEGDLREFLNPLKAAEIYMVITIMYLGRDNEGVAGLMDSYGHMSDTFASPGHAIGQMLEKANLDGYLRAGLEKLAQAHIDVDSLLTTHFDSPLAILNSSEGVELHLGQWYCDTCGKPIEKAGDGMLQWLTRLDGDRQLARDLRIVHHTPKKPSGSANG